MNRSLHTQLTDSSCTNHWHSALCCLFTTCSFFSRRRLFGCIGFLCCWCLSLFYFSHGCCCICGAFFPLLLLPILLLLRTFSIGLGLVGTNRRLVLDEVYLVLPTRLLAPVQLCPDLVAICDRIALDHVDAPSRLYSQKTRLA